VHLRKILNTLFLSVLVGVIFISGCGVNASKEGNSGDETNISSDQTANETAQDNKTSSKEIGFDIKQVGAPFPELKNALDSVLKGTSEDSIFSSETEGMLNGVSIRDDGTVIVDFANFSNIIGSTSAETGKLLKELNSTVFQFDEVSRVYYQFDGSFTSWCNWLQIIEEPITREEWEQ
jgi:hypothetical protein